MKEEKYNYCFDFLKGIACIFVVLMHCELPGELGVIVQTISRFSVPFFFMVSGYYSYNSVVESTVRRLKRIIKMTCIASVFYIVFAAFQYVMGGEVYFHIGKNLIVWILFNQPVIVAGQMWFLFALIYVYVLYYFVQKTNAYKVAYYMIPIMIIVYIILAQGMYLIGVSVPNFAYRNFLIEGFPMFMLGNWLHKKEEKIKIDNSIIIGTIVIATVMCVVERAILGRDFGVNICSFVQVTAIFIYGINNGEKHKGIVQEIGKKFSMFVYILHPFVWHCLEMIYSGVHISTNIIAMYMMPVLVIVFSMLLSWGCYTVMNTDKRKV